MKTLLHLYNHNVLCPDTEVYRDYLSELERREDPLAEPEPLYEEGDMSGDGMSYSDGSGITDWFLDNDEEGSGDGIWYIQARLYNGYGGGGGDGSHGMIGGQILHRGGGGQGAGDMETGNHWEQKEGIITLVKRN